MVSALAREYQVSTPAVRVQMNTRKRRYSASANSPRPTSMNAMACACRARTGSATFVQGYGQSQRQRHALAPSNDVGEAALHAPKIQQARTEQHQHQDGRDSQGGQRQ